MTLLSESASRRSESFSARSRRTSDGVLGPCWRGAAGRGAACAHTPLPDPKTTIDAIKAARIFSHLSLEEHPLKDTIGCERCRMTARSR